MGETIRCVHCGCVFERNPRIKTQRQRARKRQWQREKLLSDPDYKANQCDCQKAWHNRHPGYYKAYCKRHPGKSQHNRLLQRWRNSRRSAGKQIAKMDALPQKVILIPAS